MGSEPKSVTQGLRTEMCCLFNEQSRVLNGDAKLTDISTELCAADRNEGSLMEPVIFPTGSRQRIERAITIGGNALDAEIAEQEPVCERN
jgi:hypothetical protein